MSVYVMLNVKDTDSMRVTGSFGNFTDPDLDPDPAALPLTFTLLYAKKASLCSLRWR